jgi:hypothetical protein
MMREGNSNLTCIFNRFSNMRDQASRNKEGLYLMEETEERAIENEAIYLIKSQQYKLKQISVRMKQDLFEIRKKIDIRMKSLRDNNCNCDKWILIKNRLKI